MSMVPPPPSMVSRTSFSEPRTPLACTSILIFPLESSSTLVLKSVAIWPTMVSRGLTSAYTRVISGISSVLYAPEPPALSPAGAAVVSPPATGAAVVSAAGAAVVGSSGLFSPQPARLPAAMAAHRTETINFFFMIHFLLFSKVKLCFGLKPLNAFLTLYSL